MFRVMPALTGFILAAGLAVPTPAHAEKLPSLDKIMTAKEKQLFSDTIKAQVGTYGSGKAPQISILDGMLAQDAEPTQFRGFLQFIRSAKLLEANRNTEAMAAVDESVRLLPGYSAPLLLAFDIYSYTDRPGDGADFLLRASEVDPEAVKDVSDYDLGNLVHRLEVIDDDKHLRAVADRLIQIGWSGKQIDGRSKLAVYAIEKHLADGDVAGARSLVPELIMPDKTYALLSDNRFRDLWPALETWAGPRLERQWPIYLDEAGARYATSGDAEHIIAYISALDSAGRDDLIISEALPLFDQKLDPDRDEDLITISVRVADALSREGRWNDLHSMFERAERVWPLNSQPNALNLFANEARYLLYQDRPAESVKLMDSAIERANNWGAAVNSDAVAAMHLYRACALYRLGRETDAAASAAKAMTLSTVDNIVTLNLCLGNEAGARNALIAGLAKEASRSSAIAILQPPSHPPCKSVYCTEMEKLRADLRSDPAVISELRKYGRILPFKLNATAKFSAPLTPPSAPNTSVTA